MNYVMLKDVCAINMGQSPDSNSYNNTGDGIPFFQGNADFGVRYPVTRKWCSAPTKLAAPGDILISVRAPIGAMNYAKEDCCIGRGLAALTPDKSKVSPEFIFWLLKSKNTELNSKGTGSTFKAIGRKVLEETMIPEISLEKQLEVSEILERVYEIIQIRKEELQKLDQLINARFVEFTDEIETIPTRMGDIATYLNGYAFKPTQWEETGLPIIRIQNLNDENAPYNYFSGSLADKYFVQNGDVLVSWATHLEAYIWKGQDAWLNQHIFKVVFDKMEVDKIYFVYACEEALRQAFRNAHGFKPTMEHIKKADFDNAIVKLPKIEVQEQFADFVTQVDKSKVAIQKALDKTQILFDSLMQKYFG